jgi:hypothetical protein
MFLLAQSMMKQGDYFLGMDLIQRIAPRNGSGYPDAHYWLALQIFDSPDALAKQQLQELQHHLTEAAKEPRLAGDASAMLGDLAMRSGHPEEAVELYTKARKVDMVWSSKLVPTLLSLGRKKEAIIAAEEAREHFRKVVLDDANMPKPKSPSAPANSSPQAPKSTKPSRHSSSPDSMTNTREVSTIKNPMAAKSISALACNTSNKPSGSTPTTPPPSPGCRSSPKPPPNFATMSKPSWKPRFKIKRQVRSSTSDSGSSNRSTGNQTLPNFTSNSRPPKACKRPN